MEYSSYISVIGEAIDMIGVLSITFGILFSLINFMIAYMKHGYSELAFITLRQNLGRTIIIGLELLIGGDIVRSIAVPPSFTTVGVLGIIVLIRAFLSMQIAKETEMKKK